MQLHQGLVDQKARHLALNTKIWESLKLGTYEICYSSYAMSTLLGV